MSNLEKYNSAFIENLQMAENAERLKEGLEE